MSINREELLETVKLSLRKKKETFNTEIILAIDAAFDDLSDAGVDIDSESHESKISQAVVLYVKGTFGYREDSEKFLSMYEKLKVSLASTIGAGIHTGGQQNG